MSDEPKPTTPTTEPEPQDEQEAPPTAEDVFKKYGIRTTLVAAFFVWFFYDGWFNEEIQAKTFNKVGAVILGVALIFCLVMLISAGLAYRREREQNQSSPTPPTGTP
jgi:uncharacterized membrane protein